jgi:hypothetical protein
MTVKLGNGLWLKNDEIFTIKTKICKKLWIRFLKVAVKCKLIE